MLPRCGIKSSHAMRDIRTNNRATIYSAQWRIALFLVAVALAGSFGMIVYWRAPGLSMMVEDALMRTRGAVAPSAEIVIVAIDEKSISRFGRFPWSRKVLAQAIERISEAKPKAIALDVLIADPSDPEADRALAAAIERSGRVVVAAQLVSERGDDGELRSVWLDPLPEMEGAATGHVNIPTDGDGVARRMMMRMADDDGRDLWSMAAETVRIARSLPSSDLRELPDRIVIGGMRIPVRFESAPLEVSGLNGSGQPETVRASSLRISYPGPSGAYKSQTLSISDVIDGRAPQSALRGRIVLIGSTLNSAGDRIASPFTDRGELIPGVEILAGSIDTILTGRFIRSFPDYAAAILAMLAAAAAILALRLAHFRSDWAASLAVLTALAALLPAMAWLAYAGYSIVLPLVPMCVSFLTAVPLTLLYRNRLAGIELDKRILELTGRESRTGLPATDYDPTGMIAELSGASAVCILRRDPGEPSDRGYLLVARHGAPPAGLTESKNGSRLMLDHPPHGSISEAIARDVSATGLFNSTGPVRSVTLDLGPFGEKTGALIVAWPEGDQPDTATLQVCREMASNWLAARNDPRSARRLTGRNGIEWKIGALGTLQRMLIGRAGFIDKAMRSIEDGLLITDVGGTIAFANPRAGHIFGAREQSLIGRNLFSTLKGSLFPTDGDDNRERLSRMLTRLLIDRAPVERQIVIGPEHGLPSESHFMLRLGAVSENENGEGPVIGIVATLSDVTRHHELQQIKNDVLALVTHELRTPITAIQGMSEILAQYEFNADQRREMHEAINQESKRLSRLIDEYLDLARLESGTRTVRRAPVRLTPLLERTMLMLEPLAGKRNIRLIRHFDINLPPVIADADLLMQAANNLINNAIKYSADGRDVIVETSSSDDEVRISVIDQGFGIPAADLDHIFEKFYRVSRSEQTDIPGTGLGLAFVREVMQLHGGRVTVESEPGVGSRFSMYFSVESRK